MLKRACFEIEDGTPGRDHVVAGLPGYHSKSAKQTGSPVAFYLTSAEGGVVQHYAPGGKLRPALDDLDPVWLGASAPGRGGFADWSETRRKRYQRNGLGRPERGWTDATTWRGILANLERWKQGEAALADVRDHVTKNCPRPHTIRTKRRWREDGADCPDVSRFHVRDWDRMYRTTERRRVAGSGVVEIGVEFGGLGMWSTADTIYGAACAAVACEILERAGYRVGVAGWHFAATAVRGGTAVMGSRLRLKDPGVPCQVERIVNTCGNMDVFRTIGFDVEKCHGWDGGSAGATCVSYEVHEGLRAAGAPIFQRPDVWFQRVSSLAEAAEQIDALVDSVNRYGSRMPTMVSGRNLEQKDSNFAC